LSDEIDPSGHSGEKERGAFRWIDLDLKKNATIIAEWLNFR